MRVFLHTNIVLDVLLNRPGLVVESEMVILRCETKGDPMFIAWHGLATAYYLLRRGRTETEAMLAMRMQGAHADLDFPTSRMRFKRCRRRLAERIAS